MSSVLVLAQSANVGVPSANAPFGLPPTGGAELFGHPLAVVLFVTLLGLVPFVFMGLTAFLKISTVLHITRSAVGAVSVPSNTVVFALSAALTLIAMAPVGTDIGQRLDAKFSAPARDVGSWFQGVTESVREPLRGFLSANASPEEKARFTELVKGRTPPDRRAAVRDTDLLVLMPAFMITELLEAFALGFAIFLPFLVIDVVIANVLLATGVHSLSANQLGMPLKLLLFVTTDGWGLLAESLITSYA